MAFRHKVYTVSIWHNRKRCHVCNPSFSSQRKYNMRQQIKTYNKRKTTEAQSKQTLKHTRARARTHAYTHTHTHTHTCIHTQYTGVFSLRVSKQATIEWLTHGKDTWNMYNYCLSVCSWIPMSSTFFSLFLTLSICTHMIWGETNITYKHVIEPGCFG